MSDTRLCQYFRAGNICLAPSDMLGKARGGAKRIILRAFAFEELRCGYPAFTDLLCVVLPRAKGIPNGFWQNEADAASIDHACIEFRLD
jgi:hypothetical protein